MAILVRRETGRRYRGHLFGPLWPFVNPLALLAVYTLVFSVFLDGSMSPNPLWRTGGGFHGHVRFALIVYAGLLPYMFFVEVLGSSHALVKGQPNLVRRTLFPLQVLAPVQSVALLPELLVGLGLALGAASVVWHPPGPYALLLPLALLPLVLLALAGAWAISSLAVYVPDVAEVVQVFLRVYFFLTPVVYPVEVAPASIRPILELNPLASILTGVRRVLLWDLPLVWGSWALTLAGAATACLLSYLLFRRLRPGFADVV
jgi:lipopolysaccharide transport system permease protein